MNLFRTGFNRCLVRSLSSIPRPRKDIIQITDSAKENLIRVADEHKTKNILLAIKGGGCNGFNYLLEPVEEDKLNKIDEKVGIKDDYNLYVCGSSLMHLLGTTVDWKKDIMGESFHFDNPMAESKCGCGTSFTSKADLFQ